MDIVLEYNTRNKTLRIAAECISNVEYRCKPEEIGQIVQMLLNNYLAEDHTGSQLCFFAKESPRLTRAC